MIYIYQSAPIAPGETCLVASRAMWGRLLDRLDRSSVERAAIKTALDTSEDEMIKVSLSPRAASLVIARARM